MLIQEMSQFEKDELILLAVNQGETKKVISQFLKKKKLQQLNVVMDRKKSIGRDYKVQGIPKTVVIDQEGVIRHVEVGFGEQAAARINAKISKLLSK